MDISILPFISVVVPYRNAEATLDDCIGSLLKQSYPRDKYEIIMVDNDSKDRSMDIVSRYADSVVLLHEETLGEVAARNTGIAAAKGEVVATTDSDCVIDNNWLSRIAEAFKDSSIVVAAGEIKAYKPSTSVEVFYESHMSQKKNLSYRLPYAVNANIAFRRSLFDEIGLYDTRFLSCGDVDLSFRLKQRGHAIRYIPDAIVHHKNVKTKWHMFRKFTFQSYYAPCLVKKHRSHLSGEGNFRRINKHHFKELFFSIVKSLIAVDRSAKEQDRLNATFLLARKFGLFCGSIRFRFLYL